MCIDDRVDEKTRRRKLRSLALLVARICLRSRYLKDDRWRANGKPTSVTSKRNEASFLQDAIIMRARDVDRTIRGLHRKVEGHRFAIPRGYTINEVRSPKKFSETNAPEDLSKKRKKALPRHMCPKIPRDTISARARGPRGQTLLLHDGWDGMWSCSWA